MTRFNGTVPEGAGGSASPPGVRKGPEGQKNGIRFFNALMTNGGLRVGKRHPEVMRTYEL